MLMSHRDRLIDQIHTVPEPKIIENSYCTLSPLSPSLFSLPLSFPFLPLSLPFITVLPLLSLSSLSPLSP